MAQLPPLARTHAQKVCSLYKKAVRCAEDWNVRIHDFRYDAILVRERFDKNAKIKDMRLAKQLLLQGEDELMRLQYFHPRKFPTSFDGVAYNRDPPVQDVLLDYWHPAEKSLYPKYFATREKRKQEYLEMFYQNYPEERPKPK